MQVKPPFLIVVQPTPFKPSCFYSSGAVGAKKEKKKEIYCGITLVTMAAT